MGVGDGELEQLRLALEVLADERVGDHGAEAHGIEVEDEESARSQQGRAVAQQAVDVFFKNPLFSAGLK